MKKVKRSFICILSFVILSLGCINVYATSAIKAILETRNTKLNSGREVEVILRLDNYERTDKEVNVYKATLVYNKNVFEEISESDFEPLNDWEELKFNEDTGEFIAIHKTGSKSSEEIVKIKLKVKDNAEVGKEDIVIKDIVTSDGKKDMVVEELKATVDIIEDQTNEPGDSENESDDSKNEDSSDKEDSVLNPDNSIKEDLPQTGDTVVSDVKEEIMVEQAKPTINVIQNPQTGDTTNWILWFALIGIEATVVIIFMQKDKLKKIKYKNKKMIIFLIIGAISLQTVGTVAAATLSFSVKGELNGDGKIDYNDVNLLQYHLINQQQLSEDALKNADINSDGNITVTDLSLLLKKVEKNLDYNIVLSDVEDNNYYPRKNEEVNLNFLGEVDYGAIIEKAIINNQEYEVNKAVDSNIYTVNVGTNDTAGIKEYHFTEVILNTGKKVDVEYTIKLEVLKDLPSIKDYTVNEDINKSKVDISFDLEDSDDSIQWATLEILNDKDQPIHNSDISSGKNAIEVALESDKQYTVNFRIAYDLDTNQLGEHEEDHSGILEESKALEFVIDYQWKIADIATYKDGVQTTEFEKNTPIQLRFQSSNATIHEPAFAVINGTEYPVTKENQQYIVNVDGINKAGKAEIKLEEVALSNGKRFSVTEGNVLPVTIYKENPVVSDIELKEDVTKSTLTAKFEVVDKDKALKSSKIILLDENNNEIAEKEVKSGKNEIVLNTKFSSKYTVKVIGTYSLANGQETTDDILIEKEIEAQLRAEIKDITSDKKYVEKNDDVTLNFVINTNKAEDIEKILINNAECVATKLEEDSYQVTYNVGNISGVQKLNATQLTYANGKTFDVNSEIEVEVLKDKPSIEGFMQDNNLNYNKVVLEFNVLDKDKAFISGKAVLKNNDDNSTEEKTIKVGKNSIEFAAVEGKQYVLEIYGTYDRDTNTLDATENKVIDETLYTQTIELIRDYKWQISDIKTYNNGAEATEFEKNAPIQIRFQSSNATIHEPAFAVVNGNNYPVTKENQEYVVNVDGIDKPGKTEIKLEEVILSNGKKFSVTKDNIITVTIFKESPEISNIDFKEDVTNGTLTAKFEVVDKDGALKSSKIILLDENNNQIAEEEVKSGANQIVLNTKLSSKYTVKVIGTYSLADGQETTDDILIEKEVEAKLRAEIKDITSDKAYVEKNDDVTLNFVVNTNKVEDIEKIVINNVEYTATKVNADNYEITYNVGNTSGIQKLNATQLIYANGKTFDVNSEIEVEVLKDKPSIENFVHNNDLNKIKVVLEFDVLDKDNAFISGKAVLRNKDDDSTEEKTIKVGNNTVEFSVLEGKKYVLEVYGTYDRDTNKLNGSNQNENKVIDEQLFTQDIQFIGDYQWNISNIETYKDGAEGTEFEKNAPIQLRFQSSNATIHEPAFAIVNGKKYSVTKENQQYVVNVDGIDQPGKTEIKLEEVILSNGKKFPVTKDNIIHVTIFKESPAISNIDLKEDVTKGTLTAKFEVVDNDGALKSSKIILLDESNNIIAEEKVKSGKNEIVLNTNLTSKYTVKVVGTYSLADGKEITDDILIEKEIKAEIRAEIASVTTNKQYVEKNDGVLLNFVINTNKAEAIEKILVNNVECLARKLSGNNYEITYTVGKDSGIKKLNITKIIYADGKTVDVSNEVEVEVLKDKPSIDGFVQKNNLNDSKVTLEFDVLDKDKAFISGKAILKNNDDNSTKEATITVGKNTVEFQVVEGKQYTLEIRGTYDRDTDKSQGSDNNVENGLLDTQTIQLSGDYKLKVNNIISYKDNSETKYFNKKEQIDISFESTNVTKFKPEKAVINGQEYELVEEGNAYKTSISGFDNSGKHAITIEKVILNNKKEIAVNNNNQIEIEVLKDKPTATDFIYVEKSNNKVEVTFNVVDQEQTIQSGQVIVYDENQQEVIRENIVGGSNTVIFDKNSNENFSVEVIASYDLDSNALENGQNEYQDESLLQKEIELFSDRKIEMKDILGVTIYEKQKDYSGKITYKEVDKVIYTYLKYYPDNYVARVEMKDMPDFYAHVKDYRIENNQCYIVLDYDNVTQYTENGQKQNKLEVLYGDLDGSYAVSDSFASLMAEIKANPRGTFVLTRDYDASGYASDATSLAGEDFEFKGTIDGNGHTIYNLNGPLFDILNKATIKNLKLENIYLGNVAASSATEVTTFKNAALANYAYSGTSITNVHVKDLTIVTRALGERYGGIVAQSLGGPENVTIKSSSVTGLKITASGEQKSEASKVGGIAGLIQDTVIEDCYVEGTINGESGLGGIAGQSNKMQSLGDMSTIKHCISKVNITTTSGNSGGILGFAESPVTLEQNISLSTGSNANRIYGSGKVTLGKTNIAISESTLNENNGSKIKTISKDDFSAETLKQLDFSENTWNLDNCSYDNLPSLNNSDPRNTSSGEVVNTNIYIPNHEILKQRKDYDPNKQIIYSNLYKLMPFYDSKYLVIDGKKISQDHILNQKLINSVLAFDANKKVMTYLTEENYDDINSIRIIFEDGSVQNYSVTYKYKDTLDPTKMYGRVAMYQIDDLGIEYNYDKYIVKQDATIVNKLVDYIKSLEYDKDLKDLVDLHSHDKRGYAVFKAYFNDVITSEENVREFVMNLLGNVDGYSVTEENELLDYAITQKVINNQEFKKLLFAYTYYSRFYGIEMGGTTVSDIMLFKTDVYKSNVKFNNVINDFWNSKHKSAHVVYLEYRDNLGQLLGMPTQGELIERAVYALTDYQDPNQWFVDYFSARNLVTESPAKDYVDTADYRAWTQLKKQPKYIMNILTLPKDSGFVVSAPGTFLVGSQMVYINEPTDETEKNKLLAEMKKFGDQMANFYNNALGIIDVSYLNKFADIQIDSYVVNKYGKQESGKCTDPFHINFNDLLNEWFRASGAGAYATDGVVNYSMKALKNYSNVWTHEIGHNQSYKFFFQGNGFRQIGGNNNENLGTEDYTDGHTTQTFGDGDVNWNLSYDYTPDSLITTNLTPDRINSVEKIDSYYKGMFEAIDFLDYVEAKAFLQLTPEEQAKVAVQIQYPNSNDHSTVKWKEITAQDFEAMNLTTVEDLWDNQIAIRPGVEGEWTQDGGGAYGSEGMYIRRWYQPYNDNGRTHSWGFKYTTWQMLGIGGYENGYLTWFTGKSKTDLDAIKKITNDDTMTWKQFKQQRYELMENSLDTIPYIDADKLVQDYVDALKVDARNEDRNVNASTNVRRINYHYLKRVTNDFREEVLTGKDDVIHISTPEEFKEKIMQNKIENVNGNTNYYIGNFVLDNDIDLSGIQADNGTIIDGYFMGKLDGNNHKITGNNVPVFNNIKFANISNLTIEDSVIQITDPSNEKTGSLAKVVEYSTLENITVRNATVSANKETGALAGNITGSIVKNTHVIDVTVSGTARVGAIAGYLDKSQIIESSSNGNVTGTGNAVGAFVGEIVNESAIIDSYSKGKAIGNNDVGGFVGYVNKSSIINCFSNASADGRDGVASFVGQTVNNSTIKNNLTLVNQFKGYKFDGRTAVDKFDNFSGNYENDGNAGTSTRDRVTSISLDGKINIASAADVETESFYTNTLGWNEKVWDFSKVSTGGIPKLKNSDPNDNSSAVATYHIKSADEFIAKITADPYGRFILDNDIYFSSEGSIIDVEFRGRLEGNNNKIIGNKVPVFNVINKAKINGLIIEGSKISVSGDNVGALARTAINSEIENVHVTEATITKADNKVGGIVGSTENSTLKVSSSNAVIMANGNDVGGLVGEIKDSTIIENCYSIGKAQGNENVGGLVGNVASSTIRNSYSATSANGIHGVAGFIGQSTENSTIANNIALGNQNRQYKFDGKTENDKFVNYSNNFEYKENRGNSISSRNGINFAGIIDEATTQQITSKEFYTTTLGWDEQIWDLSNVSNEFTPKLQGLDPNATKAVGVYKADIYSVDEFIAELSAHPDGEFTIMNDLDFVDKSYNVGTVLIPGVFDGVIKGNGHTIKNLKNATIFEQFNGEVYDLNVDNFNYGAVYFTGIHAQFVSPGQSDRSQSNIAVFAKKSLNAIYSNMKFSRITIFGHDNVAVVVSVDNNSTFEKIDIRQAYVNAGKNNNGGNKISTFISEKTGGSIKNCYVHGEIFGEGKITGGIIGISHGDVTIENVISNIYASNGSIKDTGTNGLFIGDISAETVIRNSASIGLASNSSSKVRRFAGTIADINSIENCYEITSSTGTSNVNGSNIKEATTTQLKDKNFYISTLGFDENIWELDNIVERHYTESVNAHGQVDSAFPKMLFFGLK